MRRMGNPFEKVVDFDRLLDVRERSGLLDTQSGLGIIPRFNWTDCIYDQGNWGNEKISGAFGGG